MSPRDVAVGPESDITLIISFDHFVGVCQPTSAVMFGYPSYKTISSYLLDGATDKSMSFASLETIPYFELNFCHDSTNFRASA